MVFDLFFYGVVTFVTEPVVALSTFYTCFYKIVTTWTYYLIYLLLLLSSQFFPRISLSYVGYPCIIVLFKFFPLLLWCGNLSIIYSLLLFVLAGYLHCPVSDIWTVFLFLAVHSLIFQLCFICYIFVMFISSRIYFSFIVAISCPVIVVWSIYSLRCIPPISFVVYNVTGVFVLFRNYV